MGAGLPSVSLHVMLAEAPATTTSGTSAAGSIVKEGGAVCVCEGGGREGGGRGREGGGWGREGGGGGGGRNR